MSGPAAFTGTFSDWKLIRTRGTIQIVFEIPIEGADEAYRVLGGMPNPAAEVWCAIARLDQKAKKTLDAVPQNDKQAEEPLAHTHKPVASEKRLVQRAAILCTDPVFRQFLKVKDEQSAATLVRTYCGVVSRSEILLGTPAADLFDKLYSKFIGWRDAP